MAGGTAVVLDARMLAHDPGRGHPERPDRLRVLLDHLGDAPGLVRLGARLAEEDEIALVHAPAHVEHAASTAGRPRVQLDPDTATSPGSYEAARLAAGSLLNVCEAVLAGEVTNGFALVRPPGHHAERDRAMGFCLFNNVAVAAAWLRRRGPRRIAIIDWDLHHGNGTQHSFADTDQVLYFSTHQYPFYPGSGGLEETGQGKGLGYTVNVPLSGGMGDEHYARIFNEILAPVARQYQPELILVSAGYDTAINDPLGGMNVSVEGFAYLTRTVKELAEELCHGRLLLVLEGGYHLQSLANGVLAGLVELLGRTTLKKESLAKLSATRIPFPAFDAALAVAARQWRLPPSSS
jgi:acetoin utilization deacetylase AcuC-like enzyme